MIRIDFKELQKAIKVLEKDAAGGPITFKTDGVKLSIITVDRTAKEFVIELSDVQYAMMPRITKTETF